MREIELFERIKNGQIFLLLGQNYFYKKNPLIEKIIKEFDFPNEGKSHDVFLKLEEKNKLEWIKQQNDMQLAPESLKIISQLPWNGVITSSVDGIVERTFRNNWREISPIYDVNNQFIGSLADRNKLNISFLFRTINSTIESSQVPVNEFDFLETNNDAITMLSKYTDPNHKVISAKGTIIIDGYCAEDDWLELDRMLVPFLRKFSRGQIHYFGPSLINQSKFWSLLVTKGIIQEYDQTFAEYLLTEESMGNLEIDELIFNRENERRISINQKSHGIPKSDFNSVTQNALILDDMILTIDELDDDLQEEKFRYFLYESGNRPVWEGYKWGFYFTRDAEVIMEQKIQNELVKNFNTNPIILEGQSGSGKSVFLGKIAYEYKMKRKYPILFIPKSIKSVDFEVILNFCDFLENGKEAERVIIFWDASVYNDEIEKYIELNNYLTSRGRQVLIIGSSYKLDSDVATKHSFESVTLSTEISDREAKGIIEVFNHFSNKNITEKYLKEMGEESIFVACYRFLPPSRNNLRTGIINEANKNKITLENALSLKNNLINNPFYELFKNSEIYVSDSFFEKRVSVEPLLDYICVPGQFGLQIPFNLILRCFDSSYAIDIAEILEEIDFFKFNENGFGEWEIGTRNNLEAEIIVKSRLSNPEKQIDFIKRLISNVRVSEYYTKGQTEIDFIVGLLKAVGPNGEKGEKYSLYYKDIALALEKARENGLYNSRLVLQESSYLREYTKTISDQVEKSELIEKSKKLISDEIQLNLEKKSKMNRTHIGRLYSELASTLGVELKEMLNQENIELLPVERNFTKLTEALQNSRDCIPDSFYPLDICGWSSKEILVHPKIPESLKEEVYADFLSMYAEVEISNSTLTELSDYSTRLLQLSSIYGDKTTSEESFKRLLEMNSGAGIFNMAMEELKSIDLNKKLNHKDIRSCRKILDDIEKYREVAYHDIRCLYLIFKLKWLLYTGNPILYMEKQTVGLDSKQWEELVLIIESILDISPERVNAVLKYIRAIGLFHLERKASYQQAFRELREVNYPFNRRIIINYIASKSNGESKKYTGSIVRISSDKKIIFRIDELEEDVPYFNASFTRSEHSKGEYYEELELGFNFLGIQVSRHNSSGGK